MESPSLIIRADAGPRIGTGHVMRCLALAQAWRRRGGGVLFVTTPMALALETRLQAEGMHIAHNTAQPGSDEDAVQTRDLVRYLRNAWVVLDGYHFSTDYQRIVKESGQPLLVLDDHGHAQQYCADIILNQNLHAHSITYTYRTTHTRLLLGARYLLLRQEFLLAQQRPREMSAEARKILVTFGGSDSENVTGKVIRALQEVMLPGLEAAVVVGGSNPHMEQLQVAIANSPFPIRLEHNVMDLVPLMSWADIAISAAGSTTWELAFMGLPSLVVVVADNQRAIADQLERKGVVRNLGWNRNMTSQDIAYQLSTVGASITLRRLMAQRGPTVVDGYGAARVIMAMRGDPLRLQRAKDSHCHLLWAWANDPDVRTVSFSSAPIPWQEHVQWFHAKLQDPSCLFFIAIDSEDVPVGQVRYDLKGSYALISLSLDRRQRNKGYGSTLLRLSAQTLFATTTHTVIHAYVKPENQASVRAFERASYINTGTTMTEGQPAVLLTLDKNTVSEG